MPLIPEMYKVELRIEQEKLKRNIVVIEEIYTLLINGDVLIRDNINQKRPCKDGLRDNVNRIQALIYLYLPHLKENFCKLDDSLTQLSIEVNYAQLANNPNDVWKTV